MSKSLDELAARIGGLLGARSWTLVTAESCTGGWVAKTVTDIAGSSAWFERGFVTYSNAAKVELLGVSELTLAAHGAVSAEVVAEMAQGALTHSLADIAVAVSGIAGPTGGSPEKPVGTVWFGWMIRGGRPCARRVVFSGDRKAVRRQAVRMALEGMLDVLAEA